MYTRNDIVLSDKTDHDEDYCELNVLQMIDYLRAIESAMVDDPCLEDMASHVAVLRSELEQRRQLAMEVAAEVDAEQSVATH